jgi:hypothetical protein
VIDKRSSPALLGSKRTEMTIPFVYSSGGFMDHAILEFEELFNAVRNVREKEEQYGRADSYTYSVKKNDKAFIEGKEHSVGLGDLALRAKAKVWDAGAQGALGHVFVIPSVDLRPNVRKMTDTVLIKKPIKVDTTAFF